MFLAAFSTYLPILVIVVGSNVSTERQATVGGAITGCIIAYVVQFGFILLIAPAFLPRDLKDEWEHRRLRYSEHRRAEARMQQREPFTPTRLSLVRSWILVILGCLIAVLWTYLSFR